MSRWSVRRAAACCAFRGVSCCNLRARRVVLADPLVLYSTITQLAYALAERYYNHLHYAWCAPVTNFDPHNFSNPPSSDPVSIYWELHNDIEGGDAHSARIAANKSGLIRGASAHHAAGTIDAPTRTLIEQVVVAASLIDFKPLLLVIPFEKVKAIAAAAPVAVRARATSEEYIIEKLPRSCFDVIELRR
jgi:hypothetical protein